MVGGEPMAAKRFSVDPVTVAAGSAQMEAFLQDTAVDFTVHEDQLADAAAGWVGSSAQALGEVMARWETKHTQHKRHVGGLAYHMATAGTEYTTNEEHSAQALRSIDRR